MAFRFSLDAVLRLRRSQQKQQEIFLERASKKVNLLTRELRLIAGEFTRTSTTGNFTTNARASELHFNQSRRQVLESRRRQMEQLLLKAREEQSAMAAELRKMWQAREVVETLRSREHQAYTLEQERREQRTQDDLYLLRKNAARLRNRSFLPS
jgi:flagellar export protein FliJ